MLDRREMMKRAGLAALATGFGSSKLLALQSTTLPIGNGERPLGKYPQKRPLIVMTSRPPQLETPFSVFNEGVITPNDAGGNGCVRKSPHTNSIWPSGLCWRASSMLAESWSMPTTWGTR